jgi:hypothetical protein
MVENLHELFLIVYCLRDIHFCGMIICQKKDSLCHKFLFYIIIDILEIVYYSLVKHTLRHPYSAIRFN